MRAAAKRPIMIGYAPTSTVSAPASRSQEDIGSGESALLCLPGGCRRLELERQLVERSGHAGQVSGRRGETV